MGVTHVGQRRSHIELAVSSRLLSGVQTLQPFLPLVVPHLLGVLLQSQHPVGQVTALRLLQTNRSHRIVQRPARIQTVHAVTVNLLAVPLCIKNVAGCRCGHQECRRSVTQPFGSLVYTGVPYLPGNTQTTALIFPYKLKFCFKVGCQTTQPLIHCLSVVGDAFTLRQTISVGSSAETRSLLRGETVHFFDSARAGTRGKPLQDRHVVVVVVIERVAVCAVWSRDPRWVKLGACKRGRRGRVGCQPAEIGVVLRLPRGAHFRSGCRSDLLRSGIRYPWSIYRRA